jgi:hypothetical protein
VGTFRSPLLGMVYDWARFRSHRSLVVDATVSLVRVSLVLMLRQACPDDARLERRQSGLVCERRLSEYKYTT